jgi:glycosyltransferase involved in cell wall biosynthesis
VIGFSVILPVRNGWPYVQECVESVLAQTHQNLELIVLDNQSADQTVQWIESLRDPRIRVYRSDAPLTIDASWARALKVEKREYMTLIGHDDVFDPGFLAAIARLIEQHPTAGLWQTGARLINSEGRRIRACRAVGNHEVPADYLAARFAGKRDVFGTGYVMRSADYQRVGGIPSFERLLFADDALWLSLMEGTYKANDPSELFSVRIHPKSESASMPSLWTSLITGLRQFMSFLREYRKREPGVAPTIDQDGPGFLLNYYRNVYIFALVEASQRGVRIDPLVTERIVGALDEDAPGSRSRFGASFKVRAVEALNASVVRRTVPYLWNSYYRIRTRAA